MESAEKKIEAITSASIRKSSSSSNSHSNNMMVATSNPEDSTVTEKRDHEDVEDVDQKSPESVPAPLPRKTWSMPKAPPPSSLAVAPKKKTLLEIMQEEKQLEQETKSAQQKALEERLEAEEAAALAKAMEASVAPGGGEDDNNSMDEDMKLAMMLSLQDQQQQQKSAPSVLEAAASVASLPTASADVAAAAGLPASSNDHDDTDGDTLTPEEMAEIEKALQDADAAEHAKIEAASLRLALELQGEEDDKRKAKPHLKQPEGNVRTMNRADFLRVQGKGGDQDDDDQDYYKYDHDDDGDYDYDDMDDNGATEAGFRINSTKPSPWSRADRTTIRGPNQELRTKHDERLQGQANAYRLELRADDETGTRAHVGNKAFNSFHRSMQKKTVKGVAAHGHGRATADTDKTRDGALDGRVRLQIARATNNGLIEAFHGCVKEGKEALVFHADKGSNSEGFDVAIKVFKRISEFKNRGQYVGGDPRYGNGDDFRHAGSRQQVEQWAEKEHRNLIRAYRAKVPVPKPLWQKENVLFLRFLGEDGWPSPQLRELSMKKGSKKWTALYEQTMEAVQRLHCDARLVHADLSEYNILVCPGSFLKRVDEEVAEQAVEEEAAKEDPSVGDSVHKKAAATKDEDVNQNTETTKNADDDLKMPAASVEETKPSAKPTPLASPEAKSVDEDSLQICLIDFGQAVDIRHPEAEELLRRDVTRVKQFYDKMGITTISVEAAMAYVQTKDAPLH